jgi:hypothetical protein
MILNIPIRAIQGLPDTVQIVVAVGCARRLVACGLAGDWDSCR